ALLHLSKAQDWPLRTCMEFASSVISYLPPMSTTTPIGPPCSSLSRPLRIIPTTRSWGTSVQPCTCWHVVADLPAGLAGDDTAAYDSVLAGDDTAAYDSVTLPHDLPPVSRL